MMRNTLLSKIARRILRRGQTGQTIVILAFGFIVLLCFVGIVTDVSLLFVRYSTLRRATDAAAVAAAGQMRRAVPTAAEIAKATATAGCNGSQAAIDQCAYGYSFARNLTNVNLAARQFIEFYGLVPTNIVVNTCATTAKNAADAVANNKAFDADLECDDSQQPRKLVRVIAQIESPTVFLRLIGWGTITLEASAISETAVLDVVMIFDASESMANQTSYKEWEDIGKGMRYLPPRVTYGPMISDKTKGLYQTWAANAANYALYGGASYANAWRLLLGKTQAQIDADNNRTTGIPVIPFKETSLGSNTWLEDDFTDTANARPDCRVRFFPAGADTIPNGTGAYVATDDVQQEYTKFLKDIGVFAAADTYPTNYDGFVPAYNFYGCCNDPDGNTDFSDLICQPFKKVRDASLDFLDRIDFVRGDRVAFVTFDRSAFLIDPDGAAGTGLPMMTAQQQAENALRRMVGVRAEPSYYADAVAPNDGLWDSYVIGGGVYDPANPTTSGTAVNYTQTRDRNTGVWSGAGTGGFNYTTSGNLTDYPTKENCFLQNIALPYPWSLYSSPPPPASGSTDPVTGALYIPSRYPTSFAALYNDNGSLSTQSYMNPNLNNAAWDTAMAARYPTNTAPTYARQTSKGNFSYEFRAGCGGSNVGAALRVGSGALLDPRTVRLSTAGGVWVMVMLGDGAAGGTDPVVRNSGRINPGNPFGTGPNSALSLGTRGEYGSYGLCPYGAADNLGALVDNNGSGTTFNKLQPRCMDAVTYTRHQCPSAAPNADVGNGNINIDTAGCSVYYDADDFARDWADYIALSELPNASPFLKPDGTNRLRSDIKLPTIFTIGYGIDFTGTPVGACSGQNIPDCLGEELLRYVADVGDNNRIDTDYQQDYVFDNAINGITADGDAAVLGSGAFGDRGACETPIASYTVANLTNSAMAPKQNCGNYFNAPDQDGLNKVFDEIASRMFTRITR